jgi:hypothetical protein
LSRFVRGLDKIAKCPFKGSNSSQNGYEKNPQNLKLISKPLKKDSWYVTKGIKENVFFSSFITMGNSFLSACFEQL